MASVHQKKIIVVMFLLIFLIASAGGIVLWNQLRLQKVAKNSANEQPLESIIAAHLQSGEYDAALDALQQALRDNPQNEELQKQLQGQLEEILQGKERSEQETKTNEEPVFSGNAVFSEDDAGKGIVGKDADEQNGVSEVALIRTPKQEEEEKEKAAREQKEQEAKAEAAKQQAAKQQAAKQRAEKERTAKQQKAKAQAAKARIAKKQAAEKAAREQKEQAAKEQEAEELAELRQELEQARVDGQNDKIKQLVEDILAKDPGDSLANTAKARMIEENGDTDAQSLKEAEGKYRKALARDPAQAEALAGLAQNLDKQDRLNEALKAYDDALNKPEEPFDIELLQKRGILLYRVGKYAESVDSFQSYLADGGENLRAYYGLGLADERLERNAKAIESYKAAISKGLEHGPTYWSLSKLELKEGKLQKGEAQESKLQAALKNANMALELAAEDSRYLQTKAEILFELELYKEAALAYAQVDEANGTDTTGVKAEALGLVRYNLGLSYHNDKQYAQAEVAFRRAVAADSSKPEYLLGLADAQVAAGKIQEAEQSLAEGEKKFPQNAELLLSQGNLFLNLKKYTQALGPLQKAYELDSKNPTIINNLGLSYLNLEQYGESRDFFRKAIEGDRSNSVLWFNLALVDMATEQHVDAITSLEQVVQLGAQMNEAYYFLTREYVLVERRNDAEKTLEKLRRIAPRYAKLPELEDLLE